MVIGNKVFEEKNKTYVMGILNVTPDSFSDGGKYTEVERAVQRAREMVKEGADIIDVGGESTRPGFTPISEKEEMKRVVPVVKALKDSLNVPISVDTYKGNVARAVIQAGADMINDISFLKDNEMLQVIAESGKAYCLMHNAPQRKEEGRGYFLEDILAELNAGLDRALRGGIKKEQLILDPGVGFAKDYRENMEILRNLPLFAELGYPLLLGTSRKSVIGQTLDLPASERLEGTLATTAQAVYADCQFVRVHDVKENVRFIRMLEAMKKVD